MEFKITKGKIYFPPSDIFESGKEEEMAKISYRQKIKECMRFAKAHNPNDYILTYSNMHLIMFDNFLVAFVLLDLHYIPVKGIPVFYVKEITESFKEAIKWIKEK